MPKHIRTRGNGRALAKQHKLAIAGVTVLGAAAIAAAAVPSSAQTITTGAPAASTVKSAPVAYKTEPIKGVKGTVTDQLAAQNVKIEAIAAKKQAAADALVKQRTEVAAKQRAEKLAAAKAAKARAEREAASRSAARPAARPAGKTYADNLDGWIRQSLDIMKSKGIPGSYEGLHRNILRESSGNPKAINDWDINAINGIPSKGLLQVIPPTFKAYHVAGTSWNIYDPVANITAACNYAADKYGSMDNVDSAY